MNEKRSNNAIWSIYISEKENSEGRISAILSACKEASAGDVNKWPLRAVGIRSEVSGFSFKLYVRETRSPGFGPFVKSHLVDDKEARRFNIKGADACLFIATEASLFAITSGGGHRIIADFVDYQFPFNMAKRLISNKFSATDVRDIAGSRSSRSETFRGTYSIDKGEELDSIWKKLVGRLDSTLLPPDSPLREILLPGRSPAVEIKSSLVLRQKLDLRGVCTVIEAIESLPAPSEEQLRELEFLDNLYPLRNEKELTESLESSFIEAVRLAMNQGETPDLDVLDPVDILTFNAGSSFRIGRSNLGDHAPDIEDLLPILHEKLAAHLDHPERFAAEFATLHLTYKVDPDDQSRPIRRKLIDYFHGQLDLSGKTYFRIDKVWYRTLGSFLENLKRDFVYETFHSKNALYRPDTIPFTDWNGGRESSYNNSQADQPGFYFGDEIFASSDRGDVELFDLIWVDDENKQLYVIHVKKDFDAKMRDACSQIRLSADVISRDQREELAALTTYYSDWALHKANNSVSLETFLSWFRYEITYVVLCSTRRPFTADTFEKNLMHSHIARREVMATRNEMKRSSRNFILTHTPYREGTK